MANNQPSHKLIAQVCYQIWKNQILDAIPFPKYVANRNTIQLERV